jgi:hypothetical protein
VFLLAVTIYFLLACLISWMVLFPSGREFVLAAGGGGRRRPWPAPASGCSIGSTARRNDAARTLAR